MADQAQLRGAVDARRFVQVLGDRTQPDQEEYGHLTQRPPPLHERDRDHRDAWVGGPQETPVEDVELIDQQLVQQPGRRSVHPQPQREDQGRRDDRRDIQQHPIGGAGPLMADAIEDEREPERQDDRTRVEQQGEPQCPDQAARDVRDPAARGRSCRGPRSGRPRGTRTARR